MEIIRKSGDLSVREQYLLTMNNQTQKMESAKGEKIAINSWALYKDINKDGEEKEILSILSADGKVFATISETFKRDFFNMLELFNQNGEELDEILVTGGTSKAGRQFVTCTLA